MRHILFALVGLLGLAAFAIGPALAANITTAGSGNWSSTTPNAPWPGGTLPTSADNVTIANGSTVTINTAAACASLTVGQGVSGVLQFETTTARTITVGGDVTIAVGGTFQTATSGSTVLTHTLSLAGNLTNNGTLDFSTNGNAAGAGITFTGASSKTFAGTGTTTDVRGITINKGTSSANVIELMPSVFTVQGVNTDVAGFLTVANGTFKISGSFTLTNRTFSTAAYTIPTTGGFWLNNPNFTVAGQGGSPANNGLLRLTQGTMTVGTATGNAMAAAAGASFIIEGATLNIASRVITSNAVTFTLSSGTVNVTTVGNATNNAGGLDLSSATNTVTISGGTINLVQPSGASNKRDYNLNANAATVSITGGTLRAGTTATAAASTFAISGYMPNLVVDNTTNTKTAQLFAGSTASRAITGTINTGSTLDLNALTLTITGSTFTNNGTLSGTGAGSTLAFQSETLAQTYTGTGSTSSPVDGITVDSPSGLTLGNTTNFITLNARLLRGPVTNGNKLTLGASSAAVQAVFGKSGLLTAGGSLDAAPTFNLGSGAYTVSYQPEGGARTTSFEIPPSRSIANLIVNNSNGVTLSGGNLTVTGTLTLTSGNVTTGASTLALPSTGTVARTSGHIVGNLKKNVGAGSAVSRTFEIGTGANYTPATVVFTSVGVAGDLTASTTAGDHPNLATSSINPARSVNRYWTLTNAGVGFTDYSLTLNFVAGDIDGGANTGAFQVRKYNAPNWSATTTGTRTSTSTQATGITSFSDFAVGEVTHTITATAGAGGSITPSGVVTVSDGASQGFTFTPAACNRIADVLVDGVSVGTPTSYAFTNVTVDHTISVSFVNNFPISASAGVHGSIAPSGTTFVTCGDSQGYTITPDVDYLVGDVLVDGVSVGAVTSYTFTNVSGPHTIAASFVIANNPPVLSNVPATATIPELSPYTFTATATDVEAPPEVLTFSLVGAPAGASIDSLSGAFTWTPTEAQGPGVYPFAVRVFDGRWNTDAPITITVTEVSTAPVLSGVPASATIPEMVATSFTASATDSDLPAQVLTFSLVGAPAGASIDGSSGVFTWTPTEAQGPGSYPFAVRVSDGISATDAPVTLTVTEVNVPPALTGVPEAVSVPELAPYSFIAGAVDADLPAQSLTFSLVGAPAGATIGSGSGVFSWTPALDQSGANAFVVRVSDGVVSTDSAITITVGLTAITDLAATQVKSGNDASGRTSIQLDWSGVASGRTVEVFRAAFGGYPLYDDAGGHAPAVPSYPPGAPWTLTTVSASGTPDQPSARDFYYYVAFVHSGGSVSGVSNMTFGALDYHLGDVSDGVTPGQGDNHVNTTDLSLLGAHYGIDGVEAAAYPYLDVGPTTDYSTDALPTTDGIIDFEDLILMAINVDAVSSPALIASAHPAPTGARTPIPAAAGNALTLDAGGAARVGETFACPITLSATGQVKGLSLKLSWDPAKVRPSGMTPGAGVAAAGGMVLSPKPGVVDAAFVGAKSFAGEGVLATVSFTTLAAGDPDIKVESVDARDATNRKLVLPVEVHAPSIVVPKVTMLGRASPNPFSGSAAIAFDLAQGGRVQLEVYSVDGRRVRTLIDGQRDPGQYSVPWDGRDAQGHRAPAGLYYVRFVAGASRFTRSIVVLN